MRSLARRLARVAPAVLPRPGCDSCHGWTWVVLEGDDGPHRLDECPDCGRYVSATLVVRIEGIAIAAI